MAAELHSIVYPARDLEATKAVFSALLGMEPTTDQPYYVGYHVGEVEIGLNPQGHAQGATGGVAYHRVDDVAAAVAALEAAGAEVAQPPTEVGGGTTLATVRDADGNILGLIHHA